MRDTTRVPAAARGPPVDDRVADQQRSRRAARPRARSDAAAPPDRVCAETGRRRRRRRRPESSATRSRPARIRRVAASGLLVSTASARAARRAARAPRGMPAYGRGVLQQPLVVDRQKPFERVGRPLDAARAATRARSSVGRAVADHPRRSLLGHRRGAARHQQRIGRLGDVLAGIDQRAVEVEDDQAKWRCHG